MNRFCKYNTAWALAAFFAVQTLAHPAPATPDPSAEETVPLIVIDDVRLVDAVGNLARHLDLNYILDPRIGPGLQAPISVRLTNVTGFAALNGILQQQKLAFITNVTTRIARIAPAQLNVKPVLPSQLGSNTGAVIPTIALEDVPLSEAIAKLANAAQLQLTLDPIWPEFAKEGRVPVSFRWQRVTARQALIALLDNYELLLIEGPAGTPARVALRTHASTPATPRQKYPAVAK
jgi:hypothetical protein